MTQETFERVVFLNNEISYKKNDLRRMQESLDHTHAAYGEDHDKTNKSVFDSYLNAIVEGNCCQLRKDNFINELYAKLTETVDELICECIERLKVEINEIEKEIEAL